MSSFADLDLLKTLVATLAEQGITTPTPIQARAIPVLMAGKSLIAVAETGSGKTLAYLLPLLHQLKTLESGGSTVSQPGRPRGVVLVPGRELGEQVSRVAKGLTHATRLRVRTTLGGTAKQIARQNVAGEFEILVATPGRLTQLLESGKLRLDDVRTMVFDESDQLLDPGFLPVAQQIVEASAHKAQLVMISATLPDSMEAGARILFHEQPVLVRTRGSQRTVETLTTVNKTVLKGQQHATLRKVLGERAGVRTIVFVNTRGQCDDLQDWLDAEGIPHVMYRGEMDRAVRRANLLQFREGEVFVLLTTDLGGRGLDIEGVERVINVNLPEDVDNYLHRVGRTARAGRPGTVVNFVTQRDHPLMALLKQRDEKAR